MKIGKTLSLLLAFGLGALGCGSSGGSGGDGTGAVTGSIRGMKMTVNSVISGNVMVPTGIGYTVDGTAVGLTNVVNACAAVSTNPNIKSSQVLGLFLYAEDGTGKTSAVTAPGTFTVTASPSGAGNYAYVTFTAQDASCTTTASSSAVSGTVKVTSVSNGALAGTFMLSMDTSDMISGTFDAASCPGIQNTVNGSSTDGGAPPCH